MSTGATAHEQVEKTKELLRLEAWEKEQARSAAREESVFNREENERLINKKAAEYKVCYCCHDYWYCYASCC